MNERVSPFAALTGAEKQIKWLEYQSIRLPYINGEMDTEPKPQPAHSENVAQANESMAEARPTQPNAAPSPMPTAADFQKARHSQYDAVIARMKRAELQASAYRQLS